MVATAKRGAERVRPAPAREPGSLLREGVPGFSLSTVAAFGVDPSWPSCILREKPRDLRLRHRKKPLHLDHFSEPLTLVYGHRCAFVVSFVRAAVGPDRAQRKGQGALQLCWRHDEAEPIRASAQTTVHRYQAALLHLRQGDVLRVIGLCPSELVGYPPSLSTEIGRLLNSDWHGLTSLQAERSHVLGDFLAQRISCNAERDSERISGGATRSSPKRSSKPSGERQRSTAVLASITSTPLSGLRESAARRRRHRASVRHSPFAPALGQRYRLGLKLRLIDDHDPCTRSLRLIEVKHIAHQLLLRGHAVNRTGPARA
jgi:hypothetical protein